jgi:hypothetical protein
MHICTPPIQALRIPSTALRNCQVSTRKGLWQAKAFTHDLSTPALALLGYQREAGGTQQVRPGKHHAGVDSQRVGGDSQRAVVGTQQVVAPSADKGGVAYCLLAAHCLRTPSVAVAAPTPHRTRLEEYLGGSHQPSSRTRG